MEVSNKLEHLEQEGSNNGGIKKLEHLEQEGVSNGGIKQTRALGTRGC